MIPTAHIEVKDKDLIAKTVLMPGDPLRAKFIADTFLEDVVEVNSVRNMLAFTGTYKGKKVTVMGSGMGMPSIGIYSYELYKFYDVENIIRVGSSGSYSAHLDLYDVVLATDAWSESSYAKTMGLTDSDKIEATKSLNDKLTNTAEKLGVKLNFETIHSSDVFYRMNSNEYKEILEKHNATCVEMEAFALFANAKRLGKNAACLLTISDSFVTREETTSKERQTAFTEMMKIALESL